jgi:hypothetical protein
MTRHLRPAILLAALAAAGCGDPTTEVTGKVTYQGKPVVYGSVVVFDAGGAPKSGAIQPDGTFRISGVRLGSVKVAVSSPLPPGSQPTGKKDARDAVDPDKPPVEVAPAPPEVIKNWVPIPNKYGDPNTSELTTNVKAGEPLNIELK